MDNYKEYLEERMNGMYDIIAESKIKKVKKHGKTKVTISDLQDKKFINYLKNDRKKSKEEINEILNAKSEKEIEHVIEKYKGLYKRYKVTVFLVNYC